MPAGIYSITVDLQQPFHDFMRQHGFDQQRHMALFLTAAELLYKNTKSVAFARRQQSGPYSLRPQVIDKHVVLQLSAREGTHLAFDSYTRIPFDALEKWLPLFRFRDASRVVSLADTRTHALISAAREVFSAVHPLDRRPAPDTQAFKDNPVVKGPRVEMVALLGACIRQGPTI